MAMRATRKCAAGQIWHAGQGLRTAGISRTGADRLKFTASQRGQYSKKFRILKERYIQMRKPYQLPGWTRNSSYYSAPVEARPFTPSASSWPFQESAALPNAVTLAHYYFVLLIEAMELIWGGYRTRSREAS